MAIDLREFGNEYVVDDCYYCCSTLVAWVLCFARRRLADTYTACDCRNLGNRLAVDWQEAVEMNYTLFFR